MSTYEGLKINIDSKCRVTVTMRRVAGPEASWSWSSSTVSCWSGVSLPWRPGLSAPTAGNPLQQPAAADQPGRTRSRAWPVASSSCARPKRRSGMVRAWKMWTSRPVNWSILILDIHFGECSSFWIILVKFGRFWGMMIPEKNWTPLEACWIGVMFQRDMPDTSWYYLSVLVCSVQLYSILFSSIQFVPILLYSNSISNSILFYSIRILSCGHGI